MSWRLGMSSSTERWRRLPTRWKMHLAIANRAVTKEDLICITGSFYLVGEAKKLFAAKAAAKRLQQ